MNQIEIDMFPISATTRIGETNFVSKAINDHTLKLISKNSDMVITREGDNYRVRCGVLDKEFQNPKEIVDIIYKHFNFDPESDTMSLDWSKAEVFLNG